MGNLRVIVPSKSDSVTTRFRFPGILRQICTELKANKFAAEESYFRA